MIAEPTTESRMNAAVSPGHTYFDGSRLDKRVYTDPAIFDLEMERLFGTAWLNSRSSLPSK